MAKSKAMQIADEVVKEEVVSKNESTSSADMDMNDIQAFMKTMQEQLNKALEENKKLQEKILEISEKETENSATEVVNNSQVILPTPEPKQFVKIVHLQEPASGLTTHIVLSDTTRDLRRLGDVINITRSQAEELAGKYLSFFENGVLAVDVSCMDFAEEYSLPIYDKVTKEVYNGKKLEKSGDMSNKELQEFFDSLSFTAQNHFLSFWLNKCYVKDSKFYNREKLSFLGKISDSDIFAAIIFEMNNNESRKRNNSTD